MTGNTLHLIQEYYKSFNQKDWKTFLGLLDSIVSYEINQGGVELGLSTPRPSLPGGHAKATKLAGMSFL